MRKLVSFLIALGAIVFAVVSPAIAQQFPTVPSSTVIGRAQIGTGPSQAIPFTQLVNEMGLQIGVNVEAWSANLDGFALKGVPVGIVVGTTDTEALTNKTINCANNTCTVRFADLPVGTQDTVLGYFGLTTMSATGVPNCTGAITYSTSTHTFACNAGAGTGTVTEQKNTASGGLTTSGNCDNTTTNAGSPCNYAMSLNSAVLQAAPSNPTNTASTTPVMMGMGTTCHLTPTYSTRIQIDFEGTVSNNTAGNNTSMNVRVGTGTAPANAAAPVGTGLLNTVTSGGGIGATMSPSFHLSAIATGLTPGTAYWADMTLAASANTSSILNVNCTLKEVL